MQSRLITVSVTTLTLILGYSRLPASQSPVFQEQNGLIVIEAESCPPAEGWTKKTSDNGEPNRYGKWTGSGYYMATRTSMNKMPSDHMIYNFKVNTPGNYKFIIRGTKPSGVAGDEANDCWTYWNVNGSNKGPARKTVCGGERWWWKVQPYDGHNQVPNHAVQNLPAGTHQIGIGYRSAHWSFDRIIIWTGSVVTAGKNSIPGVNYRLEGAEYGFEGKVDYGAILPESPLEGTASQIPILQKKLDIPSRFRSPAYFLPNGVRLIGHNNETSDVLRMIIGRQENGSFVLQPETR